MNKTEVTTKTAGEGLATSSWIHPLNKISHAVDKLDFLTGVIGTDAFIEMDSRREMGLYLIMVEIRDDINSGLKDLADVKLPRKH